MKNNWKTKIVKWEEIRRLSRNIITQINNSNVQIDTLVTIFRGGSILSLILGANIKNVNTSCLHIKRSLTNEVNSEFGNSIFKGITNENEIKGKNILITEDIIDSGLTLDRAIEILKEYKPKNIYIATFYNFNKKKYKISFTGEFVEQPCWFIFPWEEIYEN